jgi:flagellar operon protein
MAIDKNYLIPQVGGAPGGKPLTQDPLQAKEPKERISGIAGTESARDFSEVLKQSQAGQPYSAEINSANVQPAIKFSAHATARLASRGIQMGVDQMRTLSEAVDKAAAKGLDDTLILTKEGAFIVSVANRTVITALDKNQLDGNVFTNIEGAVVMS